MNVLCPITEQPDVMIWNRFKFETRCYRSHRGSQITQCVKDHTGCYRSYGVLHITECVTDQTVIWWNYPKSQRRENILFEQRGHFATESTHIGPCLKMISSYHSRYRFSHYKVKTIVRLPYVYNGKPCTYWHALIFFSFFAFVSIVVVLVMWLLVSFLLTHLCPLLLTWFNFNPSMDK